LIDCSRLAKACALEGEKHAFPVGYYAVVNEQF
jgi:hypothetical protein